MTFWRAFIGCFRVQEVHIEITLSLLVSGHTLHSPEAHQATHKVHINGTLWFINVQKVGSHELCLLFITVVGEMGMLSHRPLVIVNL